MRKFISKKAVLKRLDELCNQFVNGDHFDSDIFNQIESISRTYAREFNIFVCFDPEYIAVDDQVYYLNDYMKSIY